MKISLIQPARNNLKYLKWSYNSIRKNQGNHIVEICVADDFSNEHYRNITLNHLIERIKIYKQERFNYSITEIKLGDTNG